MKSMKLRQSNKGFTLVEILVTLVLFSVILSVTTFGIISWQHYSINTEQNENAELVYMAVKNKIAILKSNDSIDEVDGWAPDFDSTNPNLSGEDRQEMTLIAGGYVMRCNMGDYELYKKKDYTNLKKSSKSAKLLFDFISPYIYKKDILNACISVEVEKDGTIRRVYYSNRWDKFTYDSGVGANCIKLTNLWRNESELYDNMVGLYTPG